MHSTHTFGHICYRFERDHDRTHVKPQLVSEREQEVFKEVIEEVVGSRDFHL